MTDQPVSRSAGSEAAAKSLRQTQILNFTLDRRINAESVNKLLERVYVLAGCPACGFGGFDIHFHVVDPAQLKQFQGIEHVTDVSTTLGGTI